MSDSSDSQDSAGVTTPVIDFRLWLIAICKHMSALPLLEIETCVAGGCVGSDETSRCESRHSPTNQQTVARLLGSSFNTHSITPSSWLKRQQHHPTPTASTTTSILCISHIMLAGAACMCSLYLNSNCKSKSNPNPNLTSQVE